MHLQMEQHEFKKQFGQNFLKDDYWAMTLVKSAGINSEDIVIEIGAGHGIVTKELAKHAKKVYALDIDTSLIGFLQKKFQGDSNVEILNQDILTWDFQETIKGQKFKVVASLPYNVAKKILRIFLTNEKPPEVISVIIQKEVADNYLAKPPKSTFLSNFINIYADVKFIEGIPNYAFYPEPKVQSSIISITKHKVLSPEPKKLISFIKMGYANPRKMLLNNLSNSLNKTKQEMSLIFKEIKIDAKVRPENLGLDNWQDLFNKIYPC